MERGVVCTSAELKKNESGSGFMIMNPLSILDLNYFTLYWDKIVCPTTTYLDIRMSNEEELKRCGVLNRPICSTPDGKMNDIDFPNYLSVIQLYAIDRMRKEHKDVDWRLHFHDSDILILDSLAENKETLRFDLLKSLPVPIEGTPLHEILEFKQRRADELGALHCFLDELYMDVMKSGDLDLQKAKAFSKLNKAVLDLEKLNNESFKSPVRFDISSSFDVKVGDLFDIGVAVISALEGGVGAAAIQLSKSVAKLSMGMISVKPVIQSIRKELDPNLAYICKAKSEGII